MRFENNKRVEQARPARPRPGTLKAEGVVRAVPTPPLSPPPPLWPLAGAPQMEFIPAQDEAFDRLIAKVRAAVDQGRKAGDAAAAAFESTFQTKLRR